MSERHGLPKNDREVRTLKIVDYTVDLVATAKVTQDLLRLVGITQVQLHKLTGEVG